MGESTAVSAVEVDSRATFQAALDSGLLDLRGQPGRYYVGTPPWPRAFAVLSMPPDSRLIGDGSETIVFGGGDPAGAAWRGIQLHDRARITGVTLELTDTAGDWDEQSHLVEIVGPLTGAEIDHVRFVYPLTAGVSRGDCIRLRCYPESRCWDVTGHHNTFAGCARSGVSIHSGLHGSRLPDGTCSTRFHHNTFDGVADQDLDGEGSGDIGGLDESDCVEWDHNTHRSAAAPPTSLAVSLYPGSVEFHHNLLLGRGLDVLGGSHHVHHNVITQSVPNGGTAVVFVRKSGSSWFHDETWTREVSAGAGPVFAAEQKMTAPGIRLDDVRMVQHTPRGAVSVHGALGLSMRDVTIVDDGGPGTGLRDAIRVEGSNVRTTPVTLIDSTVSGPFRALLSTTGWYAGGVGSFDLRDNTAPASSSGLRCEDVDATATSGGISGPVTYVDNTAGSPTCSVWSAP